MEFTVTKVEHSQLDQGRVTKVTLLGIYSSESTIHMYIDLNLDIKLGDVYELVKK